MYTYVYTYVYDMIGYHGIHNVCRRMVDTQTFFFLEPICEIEAFGNVPNFEMYLYLNLPSVKEHGNPSVFPRTLAVSIIYVRYLYWCPGGYTVRPHTSTMRNCTLYL